MKNKENVKKQDVYKRRGEKDRLKKQDVGKKFSQEI
jgi:hypothetical protein